MPLDSKKLSELVESDIQDLIANGVEEGREIDYKQLLKTGSDGDKKEFLADVSSFANASGGHLVFGVAEVEGRPTEIKPLRVENWDKERLQLEGTIRDGISPRIAIEFAAIPIAAGGWVIVLRIPRSWTGPHMIVFQRSGKFFSRHSAGKCQLDVGELRTAFTSRAEVADSIRAFRQNRLAAIVSGETPMPMSESAKVVIHCVPYSSASAGSAVDLRKANGEINLIKPIYGGFSHRYNIDGLLSFSQDNWNQNVADSYFQLFRDGQIECVDTTLLDLRYSEKKSLIPSLALEAAVINCVNRILKLFNVLSLQPPAAVMVSLLGVKSYELAVAATRTFQTYFIDRDALIFAAEIADGYEVEAASLLRPTMDALWNSAGLPNCRDYDAEGKPTKELQKMLQAYS